MVNTYIKYMLKAGLGISIAILSLSITDNSTQIMVLPAKEVFLIEASQNLLLAAKTNQPTDSLVQVLKNIPKTELLAQLQNDNQKKAFWINLYNAYTQIILRANPEKYKNRNKFFSAKVIDIAGQKLSLDIIEHGLLRRSKLKWSLGHFNKPFPTTFEKKHRVKKLDYRIHFALNCGAKSCPPIAFYDPEKLDKELELATKVYLMGEAAYNSAKNSVAVPALMGWFRADFGGKKNMKILLKKLEIIPQNSNPSITFQSYDWELFLENYKIT